jgi:hypothetical protein
LAFACPSLGVFSSNKEKRRQQVVAHPLKKQLPSYIGCFCELEFKKRVEKASADLFRGHQSRFIRFVIEDWLKKNNY